MIEILPIRRKPQNNHRLSNFYFANFFYTLIIDLRFLRNSESLIHRCMPEILQIQRKTLFNQSINQSDSLMVSEVQK